MSCHQGLYLELTVNEGSKLRYHLKRGNSIQIGSAIALPRLQALVFLCGQWPVSARPAVPARLYISLLSLDSLYNVCSVLMRVPSRKRGEVKLEVSRDWRFYPPNTLLKQEGLQLAEASFRDIENTMNSLTKVNISSCSPKLFTCCISSSSDDGISHSPSSTALDVQGTCNRKANWTLMALQPQNKCVPRHGKASGSACFKEKDV